MRFIQHYGAGDNFLIECSEEDIECLLDFLDSAKQYFYNIGDVYSVNDVCRYEFKLHRIIDRALGI